MKQSMQKMFYVGLYCTDFSQLLFRSTNQMVPFFSKKKKKKSEFQRSHS